jgi:hypothetical protein
MINIYLDDQGYYQVFLIISYKVLDFILQNVQNMVNYNTDLI